MAELRDRRLRVLLIGDSGVGKSCLLTRFVDDRFSESKNATIGIDFKVKTLDLDFVASAAETEKEKEKEKEKGEEEEDGKAAKKKKTVTPKKKITLQIWDTAGQERFQAIVNSYYRGSSAVVVAYDITNRASFENIGKWVDRANEACATPDLVRILVGCKSDAANQRAVEYEEGKGFADLHDMTFLETSAKDSSNTNRVFEVLARALAENLVRLPPPLRRGTVCACKHGHGPGAPLRSCADQAVSGCCMT